MTDTREFFRISEQAPQVPAVVGCPAVADFYPWLNPAEVARRLAGQRVAPVVVPTGDRMWLVCGHTETLHVLADPALSRSATAEHDLAATPAQRARRDVEPRDPEASQALRRTLAPAFTARQARSLAPWIERTARRMVEDLFAAGPCADIVTGLAEPLPMGAIGRLFDLSPDFLPSIAKDAHVVGTERESVEEIDAARARIKAQVVTLIDERRKEPRNTHLDRLIALSDNGGLPDDYLAGLVRDLLIVGWHETARRIATGVHTLLNHPDQYELLRSNPSLVPQAVEELLRHEGYPSDLSLRMATRDTMIAGTRIPAGEAVVVSSYAADHDPLVYPDPDRLDITRSTDQLLAFGRGSHRCLGSDLARTILKAAFTALCRLPPLEPAGPPTWRHGWVAPSLHRLPVTLKETDNRPDRNTGR